MERPGSSGRALGSTWSPARDGDRAAGEEVLVGQRVARILDTHGETVEEVLAPTAGVVLTVPVDPAAGTGTWAYEIGW